MALSIVDDQYRGNTRCFYNDAVDDSFVMVLEAFLSFKQ